MFLKGFTNPLKFVVLVCAIAVWAMSSTSCYRTTNPNLYFDIDTLYPNVYITNTDSTELSLYIKFLTGSDEPLTLSIAGLPPKTTLTHDSITGTPNFYANFMFHCDSTPLGIYPAQLITYSSTTHVQYRNFNIVVVYANCAKPISGRYLSSYSCNPSYFDSLTISAINTDSVSINNIGGYGTITNAITKINCNTDSLYIQRQNIGNAVTMYGKGYLNNQGKIVLNYTAINPPTARGDSVQCTMTLSR